MARAKVDLDHAGIAFLLKSGPVQAMVRAKTEEVAQNVRALSVTVEGVPGETPVPVETGMTTTDRAHGTVSIAHPSGEAVQAKHGALTKAAAQAGLDVKGRK